MQSSPELPSVDASPSLPWTTPQLSCPFAASAINPYAPQVHGESVAWACQFGLVSSADAVRSLERASIARLTARAFPFASRDVLRLATDWTSLFCLLDDAFEAQPSPLLLSAETVQLGAAIRGEEVSSATPARAALLDLRVRLVQQLTPGMINRFTVTFDELLAALLWESINRWKQLQPSYACYQSMRQLTIGMRPQFLFGEVANGIELSEQARSHPDILELQSITCSLVACANDFFTCGKELAHDLAHNVVFILMREQSLALPEAVCRLAHHHDQLMSRFVAVASALPELLHECDAVCRYVEMLKACIRGHLDWASQTARYSP